MATKKTHNTVSPAVAFNCNTLTESSNSRSFSAHCWTFVVMVCIRIMSCSVQNTTGIVVIASRCKSKLLCRDKTTKQSNKSPHTVVHTKRTKIFLFYVLTLLVTTQKPLDFGNTHTHTPEHTFMHMLRQKCTFLTKQ